MGNRGRPPHPATRLVEHLVVQAFDDASIVEVLRQLDVPISRRTVERIRAGEQRGRESASLLRPGERRVPPRDCPGCGGRIDVVPCRLCEALGPERARAVAQLDRRAAARAGGPGLRPEA